MEKKKLNLIDDNEMDKYTDLRQMCRYLQCEYNRIQIDDRLFTCQLKIINLFNHFLQHIRSKCGELVPKTCMSAHSQSHSNKYLNIASK